jgi:hypothetical protein
MKTQLTVLFLRSSRSPETTGMRWLGTLMEGKAMPTKSTPTLPFQWCPQAMQESVQAAALV